MVIADMAEQNMITRGRRASSRWRIRRARCSRPAAGSVNYVADWVMDAVDDLVGQFDQDIVVANHDRSGAAKRGRAGARSIRSTQKGEKLNIGQGALVAMTPDGVVRALVGGRNYGESQFNRAIDAKRQPGSAFKPFVYLTALEHGLTPDTVREDAPIAVKGWKPENFEHEYAGPVTLTQALANSLNTVSVRLTLEFGPDAVVRTAYRLGITSMLEPNASIALGTSEVSPLELVSAYAHLCQWRARGFAACRRAHPRRRRQDRFMTARSQPLGRIVDARYVGDDEHDDARDAGRRAPHAAPACPAGRPPARPAPARISATPGSSATPRTSSPASGSATTTTRRPAKPSAAACRSKSGAGS